LVCVDVEPIVWICESFDFNDSVVDEWLEFDFFIVDPVENNLAVGQLHPAIIA